MKIKFWNKIAESRIAFIAFLFWLWFCVSMIMFLLYSVILDNEPLKRLLE
jgi:hypothetical protein